MKLITLNLWGGHLRNPLLKFIHNHKHVDFFCLQEVYFNAHRTLVEKDRDLSLNIFADLQKLLPDHQAIFKPAVENVYGLAMLIHNDIKIINEGAIDIHKNGVGHNHDRNLQWIECLIANKHYFILNVHGLWNGHGKKDTPERIEQSHRIREFLDTVKSPIVLCGDFNLRPDTVSMNLIEQGLNNHITMNRIKSTRTRFYTKEEKYADYILSSPDINVNQFTVMPDEVSDHAPLLLDFN